jgi:cytidyltransferase-like protein
MRSGICSGFFNPIHQGHIEYIQAAKANCDQLVVIVNNDIQVEIKKSKPFMDEEHRRFIVSNIKGVDLAIISTDEDDSSADTIEAIAKLNGDGHTIILFNSGDRNPENSSEKENEVCKKYNIEEIFLPLKKTYSSRDFKA